MTRHPMVCISAALALASAWSVGPADAALRQVAIAASPAVGGGADGDLAYLQTPTVLVVIRQDSSRHEYAVPTGCVPGALTNDVAALTCPAGPDRPRAPTILRLSDGRLKPVAVPPEIGDLGVVSVGAHWLLGDASFYTDAVGHFSEGIVAIDWTNGGVLELGRDDPLGVRSYADLDSATLRRRLCAPITRARYGGGASDRTRYAVVSKIGPWVLQSASEAQWLQRCGHPERQRFGRNASAVLGVDRVAYLHGASVRVRDLRHGTVRSIPWPTRSRPVIALAGRRLIVSEPTPDGKYVIYGELR
ncbi:MAG: hypothetical protein JWO74_492 [Solirubrobacterales bacterium]|nr:hypothetical protein [Solirubrobacterales bacterium]